MEMLLMGAALSMFGLAVSCLAFGAATREEPAERPQEPAPAEQEAVQSRGCQRALLRRPSPRRSPWPPINRVPIEALLLQIENHVRLEQAAAECFLRIPQRRPAAQQNHLPAGELT